MFARIGSRGVAAPKSVEHAIGLVAGQAVSRILNAQTQEFFVGDAVDEGTILALGESVAVPAGSFDNVLRILDSSALFPQFGHKSYAPGIGPVQELDFNEAGIHVGTVELVSAVPEPGCIMMLALGIPGLLPWLRPCTASD